MEFFSDVICPHCGIESQEHFEFDFNEADRDGCPSAIFERTCGDCDKKFWFEASLRFEIEIETVFDKKPRMKK